MKWPMLQAALMLASGALLALTNAQPAAVVLAPAIPPAPRARAARDVFFTHSQAVYLAGGTFRLSSTPDGRGELCSDDQVTVQAQNAQRIVWRWMHVFASSDRRTIACVAPQAVVMPASGSYTITITLKDLFPDTYSSRPYYLVLQGGPANASAARERPQPHPTAGAPTMAAPVVSQPLATAAPRPGLPARAPGATPLRGDWPAVLAWAAGTMLVGIVAVLVARRYWQRARRLRVQAILDLFDQETREARTLALAEGATLIARHPLRATQLAAGDVPAAIARIQLAADGAQLSTSGAAEHAPIVLRPSQRYELASGAVVLRYRGPVPGARHTTAAQKGWTR